MVCCMSDRCTVPESADMSEDLLAGSNDDAAMWVPLKGPQVEVVDHALVVGSLEVKVSVVQVQDTDDPLGRPQP